MIDYWVSLVTEDWWQLVATGIFATPNSIAMHPIALSALGFWVFPAHHTHLETSYLVALCMT